VLLFSRVPNEEDCSVAETVAQPRGTAKIPFRRRDSNTRQRKSLDSQSWAAKRDATTQVHSRVHQGRAAALPGRLTVRTALPGHDSGHFCVIKQLRRAPQRLYRRQRRSRRRRVLPVCRLRSPDRIVHAIDPLRANVDLMRTRYRDRTNLIPLQAGLGSVDRVVDITSTKIVARGIGGKGAAMLLNVAQAKSATLQRVEDSRTAFRVLRLDDMFAPSGAWAHEKLAFAHFDVEGSELDVLQGAREVIARDRPIFTAEVATGMTEYAEKLLEEIGLLGYEAYAFAEKCGENRDCRNLICLPKDRALPILSGVPLLASGSYLVNSSTMLNKKMSWQLKAGRKQAEKLARSATC